MTEYKTNFRRDEIEGNALIYGEKLMVQITGAEVVTGQVRKGGKLLQIRQSSKFDYDKNAETILFSMKTGRFIGKKLPRGDDYELITWFWDNDIQRGGGWKDKFSII